jgi:hypothetical protein
MSRRSAYVCAAATILTLFVGPRAGDAAVQAYGIRIPDFRAPAPTAIPLPESCTSCGRVTSVREVARDPRAVAGGFQAVGRAPSEPNLVGAVLYLPLGTGTDKPFVGGVGTPEMKERFGESSYLIAIRMDDGSMRSLTRPDGAHYFPGDRVRLSDNGALELIVQ